MALKQHKLREDLGIHLRDIYVINGKAARRKGWGGGGVLEVGVGGGGEGRGRGEGRTF